MKCELIIPIEVLRGKLRNDGFYFRKYRGQQIVQRCPNRTYHERTFAEIAFRTWLHSDADYLRSQGISPKTKLLPPQVVAHLVEKYNIEIRD